jgi:hypothetical protein
MAKQNYRDPQGRHIRVYVDLLNSPAYRALGYSARALFFDMRASVGPSNNGDINATLSKLKHRGWNNCRTVANALRELLTLGFVVQTRPGTWGVGKGTCALFGFTDIDIHEQKGKVEARRASFDYRQFESLGQAERAIKEGVAELKRIAKQRDDERKARAVAKKKHVRRNFTELSDKTSLNGAKFSEEKALGAKFSVKKKHTEESRPNARKTLKDKNIRARQH